MKGVMRCLSIYDGGAEVHCSAIYRKVQDYFVAGGFSLADCSLLVSGRPKAKRLNPLSVYEAIRDQNDIDSIEGHIVHPEGADGYFIMSGSASLAPIIFVQLLARSEAKHSLERLIESLAEICLLNYGYVFDWGKAQSPAFYALGITHQLAGAPEIDAEQQAADARWFNERAFRPPVGRRYRDTGMLRGIYELNILNANHLKRTIDGNEIAEAIRCNGWGGIKKLPNGAWLWRTDQESRDEIETRFKDAGLLI
jgi:hypothetical protein